MKEFEVIALGRFTVDITAENEEAAYFEMQRRLPEDFKVDEIEVMEL
jgi:hypothetical protein